jgi:hypothetical protein
MAIIVSNIDHPTRKRRPYGLFRLSGNRRTVLVYSFSIRHGDDNDGAVLGCADLLNDHAALAFGNDVIRDMLRDNTDPYDGWMMDIAEGERDVCSVAFPFLSRGRMRT